MLARSPQRMRDERPGLGSPPKKLDVDADLASEGNRDEGDLTAVSKAHAKRRTFRLRLARPGVPEHD